MAPRKRSRDEDVVEDVSVVEATPLQRLRNMWQFASLMQYITLFGSAVRLDPDFDINDLERECLQPEPSDKLAGICLALLKFVSSHKPLNMENFDEYTRRQFVMKAPGRNPYGTEEEPAKFAEFHIATKVSVLQQLAVWTWGNADRMRALLGETEEEQLQWRMDPFGWDSQLRVYFVLHDRLYRRTDPPPPPAATLKAKSKTKKTRRGGRASKRLKVSETVEPEEDGEETIVETEAPFEKEDDGLGGAVWECIAVTLEEYNAFLDPLRRSRNRDEKDLVADITQDVLPELERHAEALDRKAAKARRELEASQKMATAKRSSRIAGKMEKQREIDDAAEAERTRLEELKMAHKEDKRRINMEEARESRMMTREQRLKEREVKRILHEEELAKLESREPSEHGKGADARLSERNRKAAVEKTQRVLEELKDDDDWDFDCAICGVNGKNLDDGTHSIACEKCGVWQHSACHGIREIDAERDDFHFVCASCRKPKVNNLGIHLSSSISPQDKAKQTNGHSEPLAILPTSETSDGGAISLSPSSGGQVFANGIALSTTPHNGQRGTPLSNPPRGHFSNGPSPSKTPTAYTNGTRPGQHTSLMISRQRPYSPVPGSAIRSGTTSPARTPSLAATQGQTSIRFSPTASPGGHLTHSYSPVFSQPSAAALSPTKQPTSSPPTQQLSLSPNLGQMPGYNAMSSTHLQSATPLYVPNPRPAVSAISPVKHASPSPPLLLSQSSGPMQAPEFATPSVRGPNVVTGYAMSLNGGLTPTLSPSVNAVPEVYETPMKRSFSGGVPPM